jgi:ribosomal subunit interface protein
MNVTLRGKRVKVTEPFRAQAGRRLEMTLGRFRRRIREVTVLVEDVNGPRKGIDKRCRISIRGHGWNVVAEARSTDERSALDLAAARAGRAAARALARRRALRAARRSARVAARGGHVATAS